MNKKHLAKDLEDIITAGLNSIHMPYKKGKSIRIGNVVIRQNKYGYLIFDLTEGKQISKTNFKTSAVAIAKVISEDKRQALIDKILGLDKLLLKHYNDAIFYNHTIKVTTDSFRKEAIKCRYDLSLEHTKQIKNHLDGFIF